MFDYDDLLNKNTRKNDTFDFFKAERERQEKLNRDWARMEEERRKRDMGYAVIAPPPGGWANPFR